MLNCINYVQDPRLFEKKEGAGRVLGNWKQWQTQINRNCDTTKPFFIVIHPGQVMIDLDGKIGDEYKSFMLEFGLPPTFTERTGNGGVHLYYNYTPIHLKWENTQRTREWHGYKIDSRGQGGLSYSIGTQWKDSAVYIQLSPTRDVTKIDLWRIAWATGELDHKVFGVNLGEFLTGKIDLHHTSTIDAKNEFIVWKEAM
jgi:hypothetical protein